MTEVSGHVSDAMTPDRRSGLPVAEGELDADLKRSVRHASYMRRGFYVVVLLVALAGQVSGAVEALHIPLIWAIPAVGALELGGIVVLANADVRRRLGERAIGSRLLSVAIAVGATAFNWLAHADHLLGGFFAGMSALGYLVWLTHTENQRRDRLRAKGDLPPTTPAYEVVGHWLRHPWLTRRAKSLAKANPRLGLYESLDAARAEVRRERRQSAISKVLHRKIRSAVDPTTADIAVAVYDLDEIADRLAAGADYDGLTSMIAADLAPERIAVEAPTTGRRGRRRTAEIPVQPAQPALRATAEVAGPAVPSVEPVAPTVEPAASTAPLPVLPPDIRRSIDGLGGLLPRARHSAITASTVNAEPVGVAPGVEDEPPADPEPTEPPAPVSTGRVERTRRREPPVVPSARTARDAPDRADAESARVRPSRDVESARVPPSREGSLRSRVHATLDAHVPAGVMPDSTALVQLVTDVMELTEMERLTISSYVQTWKRDAEIGRKAAPTRKLTALVPGQQ